MFHRREQPRTICSLRGVQANLESVDVMAGMNPLGRDGNHSGHPPQRPGFDRGAGSSGGMEEEVRENGQGNEDPGERWFR